MCIKDFHIYIYIYMIFVLSLADVCSSLDGFITSQLNDQLPVSWLTQLVERCTVTAEVMSSNPIQAWNFIRPFIHQCLSNVHYCEDHFHIHFLIRSSHIWFSCIQIHLKTKSFILKDESFDFPASFYLNALCKNMSSCLLFFRGSHFQSVSCGPQ